MGVVYKAQDLKLDRFVALKFLPSHLGTDEEEKTRFVQEAKAASALDHPNICNVHEIDETEDGQIFIALAYYEGETLKKKIECGPLKLKAALGIAVQIAQGLARAHEAGITHRDIKPANIMVTERGEVKIVDFGLAKLTGEAKVTRTGTTIGTVAYMSPEQARGEPVDHRSDIWSLGVVLYEMIAGELPFKGEYEQAVAYQIINSAPEQLINAPKDVELVIFKALAKMVALRYQNIGDMMAELKSLRKELKKDKVTAKQDKPSIAVLPFVNMSADPEQEYFCEGMAEEIINALTHVKDLRVAARTSSFSFRSKEIDVREIGKKLNVEHALEGSVRKAGDRLRVTAQLVKVADGYHLWSERYDREMEDVFAMQDEITLAIVEKLKIELLGEEEKAIVKRYTDNIEAYNLYLKGRFFWNQRYKGSLLRALENFEKAINVDPAYALAYSGVADCYNILGTWHFMPPKEAFSKARAAAEKALELDENLNEGYTSLGYMKMLYDWDWHASESAFKRAIVLNPNYAYAHSCYSLFLSAMGRSGDAIRETKRAQELEPLSVVINAIAGYIFYSSRQYDQAIIESKNALDIDPNSTLALCFIGATYSAKSMHAEAIAAWQKAIPLTEGSTFWLAGLGSALAIAGKEEKAWKILENLQEKRKKQYVAAWQFALFYIGLHEKEKALEWLERSYQEHNVSLYLLKTDPIYDEVRGDPRFTKLLRKMSLEK